MEEKNVLDFEAVALLENGIGYAAGFETNGLYKVNLHEGKCRYITLFPNENLNGKRLYRSAIFHDSKIYFIPESGEYISIFDIHTQEITQVPIPLPETEYVFYKRKLKFCKGVYHNGNIYMIPFTYPGVLKFNIKTHEITPINNWIPDEGFFFRGGVCVDGSRILVPSGTNNIVLEFDMETEHAVVHRVGIHNKGTMCICKYMDYYVLAPRLEGAIIVWRPHKDELLEILDYPREFKTRKIVFSEVMVCANRVFLMPATANRVLSFDADKRKVVIEERWKPSENAQVASMFETEEYYYFRESRETIGECRRYRIRKEDGQTENYTFVIENKYEYEKEYFDESIVRKSVMSESNSMNLEDFLKLV